MTSGSKRLVRLIHLFICKREFVESKNTLKRTAADYLLLASGQTIAKKYFRFQ